MTQKSQHTRDNWKKNKTPQKNKAPDSQTSQATCQTKEIDRAHRSHSTREAKQNEKNKKNQGSPIKTIKSHNSILVPLLGRGVFTAGFHRPGHSLHLPTNGTLVFTHSFDVVCPTHNIIGTIVRVHYYSSRWRCFDYNYYYYC